MCGLVGFLSLTPLEPSARFHAISRMGDAVSHRGPDAWGTWEDTRGHIVLGHRRLSILDLSDNGRQPMVSPSGRWVIIFNGEIYNHLEIRALLENPGPVRWRGTSDTETLLAGFDHWGVERTLHLAVGMFAMCIWDCEQRTLTLVRDRIGEKPLYYGWQGSGRNACFVFGSELSALRAHPTFSAEIDRDSLAALTRYSYIGGSRSIYRGVYKLRPGHLLTTSCRQVDPVVRVWWDAKSVMSRLSQSSRVASASQDDRRERLLELDAVLLRAVKQQMLSDVPIGALLSGGVDSSTVAALMQSQSSVPIRTFSIGFDQLGYDEAAHAKKVANHLGTEHTELYISARDAIATIPRLATIYSEPFADSSQIPTFLVSQLARGSVTVALSGDAGDELFGGYRRYQATAAVWNKVTRMPMSARKHLAWLLGRISPQVWRQVDRFAPGQNFSHRIRKGFTMLDSATIAELYQGLTSTWMASTGVVLGSVSPAVAAGDLWQPEGFDNISMMMATDLLEYLPEDILTKVDRAGMSVGLETRVPFLDHRVVEFAWSLPVDYKLRGGTTKWALREVLYKYVPKALIERPKMGFSIPIHEWLRGPLRDWAESLLEESRLRDEGYFDSRVVRRKWSEHLAGRENSGHSLWNVLMFQAWLEAGRA